MALAKHVPAKRLTVTATSVAMQYTTMSTTFRQIRCGSRNPLDCCYFCKHKFDDGEQMALGLNVKQNGTAKGNKVFCQTCAADLDSEAPSG